MTDVIDRIGAALDRTGAIVAALPAARLAEPSLCAGWDLRAELNHLVGGVRIFAAELTGTDPGGAHHDDWVAGGHAAAYESAAALDRPAWRRPDALDGVVRLGFGEVPAAFAARIHLLELVAHGADLAVAAGRTDLVDEAECERMLAELRAMEFDADRRPGMFGPATAPAGGAGAAPHVRLLAFLGRDLA